MNTRAGLLSGMTELPAQDAQPQDPQNGVILWDLAKQLILIDRCEQRALSRRKFAIRAFDLARQEATRDALAPTADV